MALTLHESGNYGPEGDKPVGSTVTRNAKLHIVESIDPRKNRVRVRPVGGGRSGWATPHQCGCFWTGPSTRIFGAVTRL